MRSFWSLFKIVVIFLFFDETGKNYILQSREFNGMKRSANFFVRLVVLKNVNNLCTGSATEVKLKLAVFLDTQAI